MSSALRIAAVTHVLKDLLNDGLINNNVATITGSVVVVSSLSPAQVGTGPNVSNQLNLFLHRVSRNVGWSNLGYPARNSRGDQVGSPPLALDLHYLLTAFGAGELDAEVLLGYGMQILHETPVLDRTLIQDSLSTTSLTFPNNLQTQLSLSRLEAQLEQIKITPEPSNTEEMSKLWTSFQTRYRPCTAYKATVVLLEKESSLEKGLPVRERRVFAVPFRHPVIESVSSREADNASNPIVGNRRIIMGDRVYLRGHGLREDGVTVRVNGIDLPVNPNDVNNSEVSFVLSQPGTGTSLRAGVQGIQLAQPTQLQFRPVLSENGGLNVTIPPSIQRGETTSNVQAFVLSPNIGVVNNTVSPNDNLFDLGLTLSVDPAVQANQKVSLLLNQIGVAPGTVPAAYTQEFQTSGLQTPAANIDFNLGRLEGGDYLIRLQVDGAESPLATDGNGNYNAPSINIA